MLCVCIVYTLVCAQGVCIRVHTAMHTFPIQAYSHYYIYRFIQVYVDESGNKKPSGEDNSMSQKQIKEDRKHNDTAYRGRGNAWISLYVKHIPKMFVVDFDTKTLDGCELKSYLDSMNTMWTETNKGYHYYVFIENMVVNFNDVVFYLLASSAVALAQLSVGCSK